MHFNQKVVGVTLSTNTFSNVAFLEYFNEASCITHATGIQSFTTWELQILKHKNLEAHVTGVELR